MRHEVRGVPAVAYCHYELVALARASPRAADSASARRAIAERYARHVYSGFRPRARAEAAAWAAHLADWGVARVACQPLGVDTDRLLIRHDATRRRERARLRTRRRALLVYAGRFAPEKHLDVLAAAVRRLGAPTRCSRSAPGRRRPAGRDRVVVVLPFVAARRASSHRAGERRRLRPCRRPGDCSACRRSRRWRAARRPIVAPPRAWPSSSRGHRQRRRRRAARGVRRRDRCRLFDGDSDCTRSALGTRGDASEGERLATRSCPGCRPLPAPDRRKRERAQRARGRGRCRRIFAMTNRP
jgi:hypothetical protein